MLATILGINEEQEERLLVITQELFGGEDPDMQRQGEDREAARKELGMEFYMLFDEIIKDRRACPRDDLATMLANAELSDGCPLGQLETLGYYLIVSQQAMTQHGTLFRELYQRSLITLINLNVYDKTPVFRNQPWMKLFAGQHL